MLRWGIDLERLIKPVPGMSFGSHVIPLVLEDQILQSSYLKFSPVQSEQLEWFLFRHESSREKLTEYPQISCESPREKSVCDIPTMHCKTCGR